MAGELQAQVHQVVEGGGVDLAGDDRDDRGVAGHRPGGPAVQPGGAVAAGLRGGGAAGGPPDGHLADPLLLQHRPVIQGPQLGQGDVRPHLHRLPGPLREQPARDQAAHRVFKRIVKPLLPGPGVLRPIGADSDSSTAVTTAAHSGVDHQMTPATANVVSTRSLRSSKASSGSSSSSVRERA